MKTFFLKKIIIIKNYFSFNKKIYIFKIHISQNYQLSINFKTTGKYTIKKKNIIKLLFNIINYKTIIIKLLKYKI